VNLKKSLSSFEIMKPSINLIMRQGMHLKKKLDLEDKTQEPVLYESVFQGTDQPVEIELGKTPTKSLLKKHKYMSDH